MCGKILVVTFFSAEEGHDDCGGEMSGKSKYFYRNKTIDLNKKFAVDVGPRQIDEESEASRNRPSQQSAESRVKSKKVIIPTVTAIRQPFDRGGRVFTMPSSYHHEEIEQFPDLFDGQTVNYTYTSDDENFLTQSNVPADVYETTIDLLEKETERGEFPEIDLVKARLERFPNCGINAGDVKKVERHWRNVRRKRRVPGFFYPAGKPLLQQFASTPSHEDGFSDCTVPFREIYREQNSKGRKKFINNPHGKNICQRVHAQLKLLKDVLSLVKKREIVKQKLLRIQRQIFLEKLKTRQHVVEKTYVRRPLPFKDPPLRNNEMLLSDVKHSFAFLCSVEAKTSHEINAEKDEPLNGRFGRYGNIYTSNKRRMEDDSNDGFLPSSFFEFSNK